MSASAVIRQPPTTSRSRVIAEHLRNFAISQGLGSVICFIQSVTLTLHGTLSGFQDRIDAAISCSQSPESTDCVVMMSATMSARRPVTENAVTLAGNNICVEPAEPDTPPVAKADVRLILK